MLYLKLVLIIATIVLWLVAPKIILKPVFSGHDDYEIKTYVVRFRRYLLVVTSLLFAMFALPVNCYVTLILTTLLLIFSTPFLVDSRGKPLRSAWCEVVIIPWQSFLMGRWVTMGITGVLLLYMRDIDLDIRFFQGLFVLYLVWGISPILFMFLRKAFLSTSSWVPLPDTVDGIGCFVHIGVVCITATLSLFLLLPWMWIIYIYLALAYFGSLVVETLNFIGDLRDKYESKRM